MAVVISRFGGLLRSASRVTGRQSSGAVALRTRVVVAAVVLVLALSAGVAGLLLELNRLAAVEHARSAGLNAAKSHAQEILAYDYRTIEEDIVRARNGTTGKFRRDYAATAERLVPYAQEQKVVVKAAVLSASVVSAETDRVTVLLFVNQGTTKKGQEETKVDLNRVRMTLNSVDGKWLVSNVEAL